MSERYWISGVQIGMIIAYLDCGNQMTIIQLLKDIEDGQFIGNTKDLKEMLKKGIRLGSSLNHKKESE